jgi:hypothetical protein
MNLAKSGDQQDGIEGLLEQGVPPRIIDDIVRDAAKYVLAHWNAYNE